MGALAAIRQTHWQLRTPAQRPKPLSPLLLLPELVRDLACRGPIGGHARADASKAISVLIAIHTPFLRSTGLPMPRGRWDDCSR